MLKNSCFLLLASLPSLASANGEVAQCCDSLLPPEPIESCQVPVGYFYPAQYTLGNCGIDISVSGEFIYWEVNRDSSANIGTKTDNINNGNTQIQTPLIHQQGYRPGFKVAAGMGLPGCDAWKIDVEYTWFHHTTTTHFRASQDGFIQPQTLSGFIDLRYLFFAGNALKSVLKFDLDFIQGTLGRTFYLGERLIVNAGSGLKAWWSSLHSDLTYFAFFDGPPLIERTKSSLWGIGPNITAQIKGVLWCGTYFYGKAGVWIPYTRHHKLQIDTNIPQTLLPPLNQDIKLDKFVYTTQLFYEGGVGLGWGTYLCNCDYHIDLLIGYDMMTNYIKAILLPIGDPHYEFYYQGLSVKAQFDF